ncbi:ABC transporter substrate-binding protein [Ammoniphilus sp. CFH 90114]|uniref:ABC transporter substrate-binding protein n=1 Tax=Ammoniphilus sp. CFH 90114 TaxID=2493665 RepID=UPI00101001DB|nr:ABC transporter substrate-binding protein [Ammoniphilus sp. CFH 90114]RXT06317.1 ABC transporter substrate-binding protein [Ammoniphilus sp. CFH 90114]
MKKFLSLTTMGAMLFLAACGNQPAPTAGNDAAPAEKVVKIGITQIVEHPSLDEGRKGFLAALKDAGYEEGKNLKVDVQIAQGDMNNNITIAQKLVNDKNDLILAIATPSAQAAAKAAQDIPVVFTAVTDPLGAKLVSQVDKPGSNVTGMSDTHPDGIKSTIGAIKQFFPEAKKVGLIYNSGEQNSVYNIESAKKAITSLGMEAVDATAATSSEVQQAAESLVGRVDAIAYFKDNTVASALEAVIQVANQNKLPFFAGDADSVKRGVFAGSGVEEFDIGYKAGEMAIEILKGKNPGDISVGFPDKTDLYINLKAAKDAGIEVTEEMKKNAIIIE